MRNVYRLLTVALSVTVLAQASIAQIAGMSETPDVGESPDWIIAIHGGAGSTTRDDLSAEAEARLLADLKVALDPSGRVVFVMTTANLKRGVMSSSMPARVAVYSDEAIR